MSDADREGVRKLNQAMSQAVFRAAKKKRRPSKRQQHIETVKERARKQVWGAKS